MKNRIGFMQGRLSKLVDGKIQAFPWSDWEKEFPIADMLGFSLMEWTLDQERLYENPLMTKNGREKILELSKKHNIFIASLTGDCFMQAPFWKYDGEARSNLQKDFVAIIEACAMLGIRMLVVPLVDNGRLETLDQENSLISFLLEQQPFLRACNIKVIFESDFIPSEINRFISQLPIEQFGINYDIGNSAAQGFNPIDEFAAYGARVENVHIKDRLLGGTTVPLQTGSADFNKVFKCLSEQKYQGNFILQTARATDEEHAKVLKRYLNMTSNWIKQYGLRAA